MCNTNCPNCGEEPLIDISSRKTCLNSACSNHGITYLHHEWLEHIEKHSKPLTVTNEVNKLMESFN